MEGTEPRIPDNSRVRLRDHIAPEFYKGMAKSGNEGWIRKHRFDRHGLPECWIEWDREHWADNMQPDQWTYEEHFDVLEEGKMADDNPEFTPQQMAMMKRFFDQMMRETPASDDEPTEPKISDLEAEHRAQFVSQVQRGRDILNDENLESFCIVGVFRTDDDEAPKGVLTMTAAGSSLTPETDVLLGMQLSAIATEHHREAALMCIQELTTDSDEDGRSNS